MYAQESRVLAAAVRVALCQKAFDRNTGESTRKDMTEAMRELVASVEELLDGASVRPTMDPRNLRKAL